MVDRDVVSGGCGERGHPRSAGQRLAVPRETAARLAGLSTRQLDYWASADLVRPSVDTRVGPGRRVRLYGFLDLMSLMIVAELKARNVSLQHIRTIIEHLKARGYDSPLTQVAFATQGRSVCFQHPDGTWEGDLRPEQIVIHEVLHLEPLRRRIATGSQRDTGLAGRIECRRGALDSKPVLAGTRVPVQTVRRYLDAGRSVTQIIESFPVLTPVDVEAVRRHGVA